MNGASTLIGGALDGHDHPVPADAPRPVLHLRYWHALDPHLPCDRSSGVILPAVIATPHECGAAEITYHLHSDGRYRAWPEPQNQLQTA